MNTRLLKSVRVFLFAALMPLLAACSSGMQVRGDSSPYADFNKYRTYGFFKPMGIEAGYNSPVFGELFRAAISREMESRGYQISNHPDLIINVTARLDDKVKMTTYTAPYMSGAYYGGPYRGGSAVGAGVAVGSRATMTENVSVFIDLVDREGQSISWQAVAEFEASDEKAQHLQQTIDQTVSKAFALYPHKAGQ